jgi:hypothetical protein
MPRIHVLHENDAWLVPLRAAFSAQGAPCEEWFLDTGLLDLTRPPPEGVFYNRMSASSHTRGHTHAPEYAGAVIEWLERHGRTVVNGRRALQLELSKVAQYQALAAHGIPTPDTLHHPRRVHRRALPLCRAGGHLGGLSPVPRRCLRGGGGRGVPGGRAR